MHVKQAEGLGLEFLHVPHDHAVQGYMPDSSRAGVFQGKGLELGGGESGTIPDIPSNRCGRGNAAGGVQAFWPARSLLRCGSQAFQGYQAAAESILARGTLLLWGMLF